MRSRIVLVMLCALITLALAPRGDAASPEQHVVAAPGAWLSTYAVPAAVIPPGGELRFHNNDLMHHDVVSKAKGPDDAAWCAGYRSGNCPLFWSRLIGLGESTSVHGLEGLEPGTTYSFYCTLHPRMTGTVVAI